MALKQYETVFILTPVLSEEQAKEAVTKYTDFLKSHGAEIVHLDSWGLRKLAYPIAKKTTGFYNLVEYKATGEIVKPLEIEFKRDERILRFLTVSLDKHAIDYNDRKHKGLIGRKAQAAVAAEAPQTPA